MITRRLTANLSAFFNIRFLRSSVLLSGMVCLHTAALDEPFTFQHNVMIPMRDGTRLAANLFLPKEGGLFPTILIRSPYGKFDQNFGDGKRYGSSGYAVVVQDCRGRGDSQGLWDPFRYDVDDGFDTQEWVGKQAWSNGKIGTAGGSYVGWTQWSAAPGESRYLTAMVPVVPFCNAYDLAYPGGAFQLALLFGWGAGVGGITLDSARLTNYWTYLPLKNWDAQFDKRVPYLHDWIAHPTDDEFWRRRGIGRQFDKVTVPILNVGGWYDIFSKATIQMIQKVRRESASPLVRRNEFAVIGPWGHGVGSRKLGEIDFGNDAPLKIGDLQFRWFEYWLKAKDTGVEDWPAYYLFVMGENRWRGENEWPLHGTEFTKFYLHSQGHANTLRGDGALQRQMDESAASDSFAYDPEKPVPTRGGNNLYGAAAGPYDQSEIEQRPDVLVYTTPPLETAVEVTGPIELALYASSSAPDTDFTGKLVDVHPDGKAYNLCEGILRARFRNSFRSPELIEPNKIYRYDIDLWVTSNLFLPKHQIRLEISSSNFPRFDRNPNTGKPFGTDIELRRATQKIYHNPKHASHLLLPIIPRER